MTINEVSHNNDVLEIQLSGRFDGDTSEQTEKFIIGKIAEGNTKIALNLKDVSFIASSGLRIILKTAKELRNTHQGDLRLANLQPTVAKVFEISGLTNVLQIFKNADQAINSFTG